MEMHAGNIMWRRSVRLYNIRYTPMLADGDTKLHSDLEKREPYGPLHPVLKEECINHVGKRLYTGFKNAITLACKRAKICLGGKGVGRLTEKLMRWLQIMYVRAIRSNATAEEMQKAILATPHHCFSTDLKPQHQYCPAGKDSWCFYNSAKAKGETPVSHDVALNHPMDEALLREYIMPVYDRLSTLKLLRRCERQGTQNANESLHSVIWRRAPKDSFYSKKRIEFAMLNGITEFNFGPGICLLIYISNLHFYT